MSEIGSGNWHSNRIERTIMRTRGWLLLLITVSFAVSAHSRDIIFPPMVLARELGDVLMYDDTKATFFLHWPESITFVIEKMTLDTSREDSVRVHGEFQIQDGDNTISYDSLYYTFGKFYVKESNGGELRPIQRDTKMYYVQPSSVTETKPYVSIKYNVLNDEEANRLVSSNSNEQKGGVRLLVGKSGRNQVKVSESVVCTRQQFLATFGIISIGKMFNRYFGFVDSGPGYMTEVQESGVRTLCRSDLCQLKDF